MAHARCERIVMSKQRSSNEVPHAIVGGRHGDVVVVIENVHGVVVEGTDCRSALRGLELWVGGLSHR